MYIYKNIYIYKYVQNEINVPSHIDYETLQMQYIYEYEDIYIYTYIFIYTYTYK